MNDPIEGTLNVQCNGNKNMNTSLEGFDTNAVRYLKYVYVRVLVFLCIKSFSIGRKEIKYLIF